MSEALARDIALLAELFKAGGWSELRVEYEGFSLLLSEDGDAAPAGAAIAATPRPQPAPAASEKATPAVDAAPDASWEAVVAPNLGTFYRAPKPGAPAFVELGQRVEAQSEVCLLEVMKLFTSVKAGLAGVVRQVCAGDGELVTGGQRLFYIERD